MGKKSVVIVCGLAVVSAVLQIVGALLPMHKLGLALMGVKLYVMMDTHLTNVVVYGANKGYESFTMEALQGKPDVDLSWWEAETIEGTYSLEEIRFHLCTDALRLSWPGLCDGFDSAYSTGIALVVILVTNLLLQAVGCYLLYDYTTRKQNPKYREIAASMLLGGSAIFLLTLVGYYFSALSNLNNMNSGGLAAVIFTASEASGATSGFIVLIMALIVQLVQGALLLVFTRSELGEEAYYDDKEAREVGLELARCGQTASGAPMAGGAAPFGGVVVMQPMHSPMVAAGAPAW